MIVVNRQFLLLIIAVNNQDFLLNWLLIIVVNDLVIFCNVTLFKQWNFLL
jgi:hypothetical protein